MSIHQIHYDRKFYQCKKTRYWISLDFSKENPRVRAHQWVWICHYGKPPKGYHIHHLDNDRSNNAIDNLEIMKGSRHVSHHMNLSMADPHKKKKCLDNLDKVRHLTKEWHRSEVGKSWHQSHALKHKFGKWEPTKEVCILCSKTYFTSKKSNLKYCSNKCKAKARRDSKVDNVLKQCKVCQIEFATSKYSKVTHCGKKCAAMGRNKVNK